MLESASLKVAAGCDDASSRIQTAEFFRNIHTGEPAWKCHIEKDDINGLVRVEVFPID